MCAVIKRGILGGFQNKIGNVVGTSWKGIAIMKSLPLSVANPRTTGQVTQRGKFSVISKVGSSLLAGIIKPLWDRFAQEESGFNAFVRENIDNVEPDGGVHIGEMIISKGKMVAVNPSSAVADVSLNTIVVNWPTALPDAYSQSTDLAYLVVNGEPREDFKVAGGTVPRSAGTATVSYTGMTAGQNFSVYLAFKRVDGTVVSNTGAFAGIIQA